MKALRPQPKAPAPQAWFLRAAGAAVFALTALYLAFPDKVFVFDGIMFSGVIERATDEWRAELFNRRHLVFNPSLMLLRDALGLLRLKPSAYGMIQKVNAVVGVLGVAVFFRMLGRLTGDRFMAGLGALALGLSFSFWSRATEGQVYMIMTFWALAAGACAVGFAEEATPRRAGLLALSLIAGMLFHAANAVLLPMAAAALAAAWRRGKGGVAWWVPLVVALGVALPYLAAFGGRGSLASFVSEASDVHAGAGASWTRLTGFFLGRGVSSIGLLSEAFMALAAPPSSGALPVAGGSLCMAACAAAAVRLWRRRPDRRTQVLIVALWGCGFVVLDAVWHGGAFFWAVPCAAGLALLFMEAADILEARPDIRIPALRAGTLAIFCLGIWNLRCGILPQSKIENNVGYGRSIFVRDHTIAGSWIILSGFGFPNSKVYIPYFAHRTREVLEYYLDRYPRQEGLAQFSRFLRHNLEFGIPMYLLSDMVEEKTVAELIQKTWGVSAEDVHRCFGPGGVIEVARQDARFRIFLFVPRQRADRLFAVLAYGLLVETDMVRLHETVSALGQIARGMSLEQRRFLPKLMRGSDFGASLLYHGFLGYMNPESERAARQREKTFGEFQRTPEFHLRLGNLYQILGLPDEVRREWTIAYRATRDPDLAANIKKLPR